MSKDQIGLRSELRRFVRRAQKLPDLFEPREIEDFDEVLTDELADIVRQFQEDSLKKVRQIAESAGLDGNDLGILLSGC